MVLRVDQVAVVVVAEGDDDLLQFAAELVAACSVVRGDRRSEVAADVDGLVEANWKAIVRSTRPSPILSSSTNRLTVPPLPMTTPVTGSPSGTDVAAATAQDLFLMLIVEVLTHPARGEIRNQFAHVIDVAPTVLEAAGIPEPSTVHGRRDRAVKSLALELAADGIRVNTSAPAVSRPTCPRKRPPSIPHRP
jgi:NAD(P)-dependent dehydrogenase (short-subunit alcohol dehydrogenase family)